MLLLRFLLALLLFTFGPGAAASAWLTRHLDPLRRCIVMLAIGSAFVPLLVSALAMAHAIGAFPYVSVALGVAGAIIWYRSPPGPRTSASDAVACVALATIAGATGAIAFAHRLQVGVGGVKVFGLYDSMDLSYYAVIASEASHTVPPTASFYSGHLLNAAVYPQLVLAMAHRFASVPLLPLYFGYAWPAFLVLGALSVFALVRELSTTAVAFVAVTLILVAGDFSYLAAWLLPHQTHEWDFMLWSTNFLSPTMEVLQFNTWTPTFPVFFGVLYGIVAALRQRSLGWVLLTGLMLPSLFQFKPFAYMVVMGGLLPAAIFAGRDSPGRRALLATFALGVALTLPIAYGIARQPDRRSRFLLELFMLPQRMLLKLDLADRLAGFPRPLVLAVATVLFFIGGLGIRWLGLPGVWRAVRRQVPQDATAWSVLGWCSAVGILMPFVLVTDPYVDTLQFYQAGLYLLWIFTAAALVAAARRGAVGKALLPIALLVSLPSSLHFLYLKWTDDQRPPRVEITRDEMAIAGRLRTLDPERAVVLHDRPEDPSLIAILADRRVVLGWGHPYYAVGSGERRNDVNAFFDSTARDPLATYGLLAKYRVTHVVVTGRDRVHPAVLARLQPVLRLPDATLYAVPPDTGPRP